MSRTGMLQTKRARLVLVVAATLMAAAFQLALQAKPAQAWEMRVTITGAGRVEETTPARLLNCSTLSTNPTGQTGAACLAGTPNGDYGNFWDVDYLATPAPGYTFKRWEGDGTTRRAIVCDRSTPPASAPTYSGSTACKFRAVDNMQTRVVFADEQDPSQPSITSTTPVRTNGAVTFNFSTTADPTFRRFECRVFPTVQTSFQPCSSGLSFNPNADGAYTFEVRAVDWSGRTSFSASRSWTVDKTAPTANITSGPSGSSNDPSPSFGFSSSATDLAGFQCSLDGGALAGCSPPKAFTGLPDGSHTFSVRATDTVGNSSTSSRAWTIDTVAPDTTLDPNVGPPPGSATQDNDPVFQFSSGDATAAFECSLTGPGMTGDAFAVCPSPKSYTNLKDGTYTFKVRARDRATNVDATPEERTWTINNTPTVLTDSLTPSKAETGVPRTTNVSAGFSEEMAPTSIVNLTTHVSKTVKLQMYDARKKRWTAVPATVDVANNSTTAVLDPYGATEGATEKSLAARKKFRATITTGVTDAQGNPIARNFVWTFNTGTS
jgi:hypothetical protein